jgi:DNA-binding beta-propeller fold protein YncE
MAIDLDTGARTNFISNGVGDGRVMIAPRELAIDEVNNRAFVADDGGNAPSFILSIDLETGNRTKVITFENEFNYSIDGMSLDSEANLIYTAINNELISVNIDDGFTRIVSSSNIGLGTLFSSLQGATLDTVNNRILSFDHAEETILSIDTTTGDRSIIASSKSGIEVGTGESIAHISALALDEKNQVVYVASQFDKNIIKIDLATNERTVLLTSCNDINLVDLGLTSLSYNETENSLLFYNDAAMKYKIDDNTCEMTTNDQGTSYLDFEENQKGQIYATGFNSLYQIDMETNEKVIISK